jgi:hypothetical protein
LATLIIFIVYGESIFLHSRTIEGWRNLRSSLDCERIEQV